MPRPVIDRKLDSRTARARLAPSGKPYWRALDHGLHLGYRKGAKSGRWVARVYLGEQRYAVETIGTADDHTDADGTLVLDWRQAQQKARERQEAVARQQSGQPEPEAAYTVSAALQDYLAWMDGHRKSGRDARYRAEALIEPELGAVELSALTAERIRNWLGSAARAPARLRRGRGQAQRHRDHNPDDPEAVRRRRASVNRTYTILRAALNRAFEDGKTASDAEWRRVKPFEDVDAARVRYLTVPECVRLINASPPDFRRLVQTALLTGCRYGELGALRVGDFLPDAGAVQIPTSKTGSARWVVLTDEGAAFLAALCAGRAASEPLLRKADGSRWLKSHQRRPMLGACRGARLDPPYDFHSLRHTYASLGVMNGLPLMVVAKNLGHADTRMVEKHYGHLAPSFVRDAIRDSAPRFGIVADKVVQLRAS